MKKLLWTLLILIALASIGYFIVYPITRNYLDNNHPEILEKVGIQSNKKEEQNTVLTSYDESKQIDLKEGWVAPEKHVYLRRDIPSLEQDFYGLGFPTFLYVTDDNGNLNQKGEKSFREDGALLYLYMDDTFYLTSSRLEYEVEKSKFNSPSMDEHIGLFLDYIRIITNKEVSEDDKNALLRLFTYVFNDPESKNNSIVINDLSFTVSIDTFYNLIIMSC